VDGERHHRELVLRPKSAARCAVRSRIRLRRTTKTVSLTRVAATVSKGDAKRLSTWRHTEQFRSQAEGQTVVRCSASWRGHERGQGESA